MTKRTTKHHIKNKNHNKNHNQVNVHIDLSKKTNPPRRRRNDNGYNHQPVVVAPAISVVVPSGPAYSAPYQNYEIPKIEFPSLDKIKLPTKPPPTNTPPTRPPREPEHPNTIGQRPRENFALDTLREVGYDIGVVAIGSALADVVGPEAFYAAPGIIRAGEEALGGIAERVGLRAAGTQAARRAEIAAAREARFAELDAQNLTQRSEEALSNPRRFNTDHSAEIRRGDDLFERSQEAIRGSNRFAGEGQPLPALSTQNIHDVASHGSYSPTPLSSSNLPTLHSPAKPIIVDNASLIEQLPVTDPIPTVYTENPTVAHLTTKDDFSAPEVAAKMPGDVDPSTISRGPTRFPPIGDMSHLGAEDQVFHLRDYFNRVHPDAAGVVKTYVSGRTKTLGDYTEPAKLKSAIQDYQKGLGEGLKPAIGNLRPLGRTPAKLRPTVPSPRESLIPRPNFRPYETTSPASRPPANLRGYYDPFNDTDA